MKFRKLFNENYPGYPEEDWPWRRKIEKQMDVIRKQSPDQNEKKLKKIELKMGKNFTATDEEVEWFYAYKEIQNKEKSKWKVDFQKALNDYLNKIPEVGKLQKELKTVWNQMEDNQPGPSVDHTGWMNLKKRYDEINNKLAKFRNGFQKEYYK